MNGENIDTENLQELRDDILDRMKEFMDEYRSYSQSSVDHFGGKADAMETSMRIVKAAFSDYNSDSKETYFTDQEYRLLLKALSREREVCEKVDKDCGEEHKLLKLMSSIEKKIKYINYHRS